MGGIKNSIEKIVGPGLSDAETQREIQRRIRHDRGELKPDSEKMGLEISETPPESSLEYFQAVLAGERELGEGWTTEEVRKEVERRIQQMTR